jgi:hypothetical protein
MNEQEIREIFAVLMLQNPDNEVDDQMWTDDLVMFDMMVRMHYDGALAAARDADDVFESDWRRRLRRSFKTKSDFDAAFAKHYDEYMRDTKANKLPNVVPEKSDE